MNKYSVLMSVYIKESPENLRLSVESMMSQTIPPDDFVLYCDGTLTDALFREIDSLKNRFPVINVIYNETALGLGRALNNGLKFCRNDIIARMDSDDIAILQRMEKQLEAFEKQRADIVSGTVLEFVGSAENIINKKSVPETDAQIRKYSKRRNPFNHPCVCFRKQKAIQAGGYADCPYFEDYYLWIRMLAKGCVGYNVKEPVLYMRSGPEMYKRRGGLLYARDALAFRKKMYAMKYCSFADYWIACCAHIFSGVIPNKARMLFYSKLLRNKEDML